jgi:hypothetical protein
MCRQAGAALDCQLTKALLVLVLVLLLLLALCNSQNV